MGRYLDMARAAVPFKDPDESEPYIFDFGNRFHDPRWQAAQQAWRTIAQCADLPKALRWAQTHQPGLYRERDDLWEAVDEAWDSGSLEQLSTALDVWVGLHLRMLALYKEGEAIGGKNL
jgi:hypothetical protein